MSLISIIIPVYFNAPSLVALQERLVRLADSHPRHEFEFVYVDDGSEDNSFEIISQLVASDPRVHAIRLSRNFGSIMAILAGMTFAKGDCVGFIAADLQDPPETFSAMIDDWEKGKKIILAVRRNRRGDPFITRIFANVFNWLYNKLVIPGFSPQGIGFFLIDRQVADVVLACKEKNTHLIALILWTGFPFSTVPYERVERIHGQSRWTFWKKLKYSIDAFVAFSYLPLRVASYLGIVCAILSGIYALVLIILRLFNNVPVQGWTALMVVLLFLSGIQMIIMGVIGEYIWRNFDATRKRPLFIIDRVIGR